jgi:hypothetical protein
VFTLHVSMPLTWQNEELGVGGEHVRDDHTELTASVALVCFQLVGPSATPVLVAALGLPQNRAVTVSRCVTDNLLQVRAAPADRNGLEVVTLEAGFEQCL